MWKRADKEQPQICKYVLCLGIRDAYFIGQYVGNNEWLYYGGKPRKVIYWDYLPEPPKEY